MTDEDKRRCIFCGRAEGDLVNPADATSHRVTMTREHVFPRSWKTKLTVSPLPDNAAIGARTYTKYAPDFTTRSARPEPLFELVVKSVCDFCNNGWMNDLDNAVEPWLVDPYADENHCDVETFRRWATKVGVLRTYQENPRWVHPEDLSALYDGHDLSNWYVFVGRALLPNHNHTFAGLGPSLPSGGRLSGLTQVSWQLGHNLVIAIRLVGEDNRRVGLLKMLRTENRANGTLIAEVRTNSKRLPNLAMLPLIVPEAWTRLVWFYSPNPASPVHRQVAAMERNYREAIVGRGLTYREPPM